MADIDGSAPEYWARKTGPDLVAAITQKEKDFFDAAEERGFVHMWRLSYAQYYGQDPDAIGSFETQQITTEGEAGEYLLFRVNETRSFVKQQITLATGQRPAFQCMALNTDYNSVSQIDICDAMVTYFYETQMGELREREVVESDSNFGAGFGWVRWDASAGEDVELGQEPVMVEMLDEETGEPVMREVLDEETGEPLYDEDEGGVALEPVLQPKIDPATNEPVMKPVRGPAGEPVVDTLYPWEVVREPGNSKGSHMWTTVREAHVSRWELVATYPEHAEQLAGLKTDDNYTLERLFEIDNVITSEDEVVVKHFYHQRCKAMPDGRYVGLCGDLVLWDEPLPSRGMPVLEMCSSKFIATSFGYSDNWDLMSINEMIDQLTSDTATNLSTFGRQTLVVDEDTDFDVDAIANGQRVLTKPSTADPPKAVSFAAMPEAVKWFLEYLHRRQESISQLNSVARGNPEGVKSGTMAALFHSIAIEYNNGRQAALDLYRKQLANLMLDLVRQNAPDDFVIEVSGLDERPYLQEFKRESLIGVRGVNVITANPMMRSQAGRLEIFNATKDLPAHERSAAIDLITKGVHKPLNRMSATEQQAVRFENEKLSDGVVCPVLVTDNPVVHVRSHRAELDAHREELLLIRDPQADPEAKARANAIIKAFNAHIAEHMQIWLQMPPPLALFLGIEPPPQMGGGLPGVKEGAGGKGGEIPEDNTGPQQVDDLGVKRPKPAEPPPEANLQNAG